jgi:hypothetical protein
MVNREQIEAFIRGRALPEEVVAEIERQLDDPQSEVRRVGREFVALSRLALDPTGPLPGDPKPRKP